MKIQSLLLATIVTSGLFAASASAITTVAPAKNKVTFEAPAPAKVIQPIRLPSSHRGSVVSLTMNVDASGKPTNVRVMSTSDQKAYKDIIATVSKWEFTPAMKNGKAVPSRIELPLEVKGI